MNIKEFINENKEDMIHDIITLVEIPTICSQGVEGKPFGEEIAAGLETVLGMGKRMGMLTNNMEGYVGEIATSAKKRTIGILAHVDVVPAGDGWETESFKGVVKEGKIFGRGSSDDKGPMVAALYAMKYLKDNNKIPADTALKLIIGTDEEEEWRCMQYYTDHTTVLPEYSIVPDGYFPLIFCEKGLVDFDLCRSYEQDKKAEVQVVEILGGTGRNIVPASAFCKLLVQEELKNQIANQLATIDGIEITIVDDGLEINAKGKSTHAMSPEKGLNAISLLMQALGTIKPSVSCGELIDIYNQFIGMDYNGTKFGCGFSDDLSGKLTLNVGTIELKDGTVTMEMNLRYPASMAWDFIKDAMMNTIQKCAYHYIEKSYLAPLCVEQDSILVHTLMDAYKKGTGDVDAVPFAIGGATYARSIPNAVAFGPLFPDEEELAHEANEYISINSLEKMTAIFADALENLLNYIK